MLHGQTLNGVSHVLAEDCCRLRYLLALAVGAVYAGWTERVVNQLEEPPIALYSASYDDGRMEIQEPKHKQPLLKCNAPTRIVSIEEADKDRCQKAEGCTAHARSLTPGLMAHMWQSMPPAKWLGLRRDTPRRVQRRSALTGLFPGRVHGVVGPKAVHPVDDDEAAVECWLGLVPVAFLDFSEWLQSLSLSLAQ